MASFWNGFWRWRHICYASSGDGRTPVADLTPEALLPHVTCRPAWPCPTSSLIFISGWRNSFCMTSTWLSSSDATSAVAIKISGSKLVHVITHSVDTRFFMEVCIISTINIKGARNRFDAAVWPRRSLDKKWHCVRALLPHCCQQSMWYSLHMRFCLRQKDTPERCMCTLYNRHCCCVGSWC